MEVTNHFNLNELPQKQNVNYLKSAADGTVIKPTLRLSHCPDGYYYTTDAKGVGHCERQPT